MMRGLAAEDYAGMTPEQIVQTRQLGQQDQQHTLQMAQALNQAGMDREKLTLEQQQLEEVKRAQRVQEKVKLIDMTITHRLQQKKTGIESRRAQAYEKMAEAQYQEAGMRIDQHRREVEQAEEQSRLIEDASNLELPTNLGQDLKLGTIMMLQNAGMDVNVPSEDQVIDTFVGEDGSIRALAIIGGKVTVTEEFQELQGMLPAPQTIREQDLRGDAYQRSMGTEDATIQSTDWAYDLHEKLRAQDPMGYGNLTFGTQDPRQKRKAAVRLRQEALATLEGTYGRGFVRFAHGSRGPGFYEVDEGGEEVRFIRGDVATVLD